MKFKTTKKSGNGTGIAFLLLGIIILIYGTYANFQLYKLKKVCTQKTVGTVTEVQVYERHDRSSRSPKKEYRAIVSYKTPMSDTEHTLTTEHRKEIYNEGEQINVMYDPNDADTAYAPDVQPNTGRSMMICGAVFGAFGVLITLSGIKNRKI